MPDALLPTSPPPDAINWSEHVGFISLVREPGTDAARNLTADVAARSEPFLARARPLGPAGRATHQQITGTVLAGLLRAGFKGTPVRAQRGKAGAQWQDAPVGYDAFWQRADAMGRAGLIGSKLGVSFWSSGTVTGKATALWCAPALVQLAAERGLSAETFTTDWPLTARAQEQRPIIVSGDLIGCCEVPAAGSETRTVCAVRPDQRDTAEAMRQQVERLNAHLATVTVRGCVPPVLRRQFFSDLRLGGRFFAVGSETFQGVRRADRHLLRIEGQRVTEVDLAAAALSIFLAATGQPIPADPYAHGPLASCDRDAVKQWFNQSLNIGRPAKGWGKRTDDAVRAVPIKSIIAASLTAYPGLADPTTAMPADLLDNVPFDRRGWALGQWVTGLEASVMAAALEALMADGVVALPLHDAVLVPERDVEAAAVALSTAFECLLGAAPRIRTKAHAAQ